MKYLKLIFLLTFFVQSQTEPINTGHAEVSLIKGSYANNQLLIGIKMDMQDNGIPIGKILEIQEVL